jgi:hypothetical protein
LATTGDGDGTYEGDVLFLEWAADAGATFADDGIDTFVFRDGLIRSRRSATRCSAAAEPPRV